MPEKLFCSQYVALMLQRIGRLPDGYNPNASLPQEFLDDGIFDATFEPLQHISLSISGMQILDEQRKKKDTRFQGVPRAASWGKANSGSSVRGDEATTRTAPDRLSPSPPQLYSPARFDPSAALRRNRVRSRSDDSMDASLSSFSLASGPFGLTSQSSSSREAPAASGALLPNTHEASTLVRPPRGQRLEPLQASLIPSLKKQTVVLATGR